MFFTVKQCFRQVLGSCTSETMCFTRVQVEKSSWGIWFSGVWKPGKPPRFVEKVPYESSLSKCECWRNFSISSHVSLDKMTINDPSAPKKNDKLERNNFHFHAYLWKSTSNFKKKQLFPAGKFPSTKYAKFDPFGVAGLVRNPTEPGGFNWKTHHRFRSDKMRVSNLNSALRSTGTFWKQRYVTSPGFCPRRNVVGDWSHGDRLRTVA